MLSHLSNPLVNFFQYLEAEVLEKLSVLVKEECLLQYGQLGAYQETLSQKKTQQKKDSAWFLLSQPLQYTELHLAGAAKWKLAKPWVTPSLPEEKD